MKYIVKKPNKNVNKLDSSMTFENIRFLRPRSNIPSKVTKAFREVYKNKYFTPSIITNVKSSSGISNKKDLSGYDFKLSQIDNSTSSFQTDRKTNTKHNTVNLVKPRASQDISTLADVNEINLSKWNKSYIGNVSPLSKSLRQVKSDKSFLTIVSNLEQKYDFTNQKVSGHTKPLRLFNKKGQPLTDRRGQPLIDIFGQPLIYLDDEGGLISDRNGDQVFNSLGESAIYSTTNLQIPPSEKEPAITFLDVDRKQILFLYDNKGHPLTDNLGRPLLNASGNLMIGINHGEIVDLTNNQHNLLKNVYCKAPLENFFRRVQIFDYDMKPLTDENGKEIKSAQVLCNTSGMPMCDKSGRPLFFKYGARRFPCHANKSSEDLELISKSSLKTLPADSIDLPGSKTTVTILESQKASLSVSKHIIFQGDEIKKLNSSFELKNTFTKHSLMESDYKRDSKGNSKSVELNGKDFTPYKEEEQSHTLFPSTTYKINKHMTISQIQLSGTVNGSKYLSKENVQSIDFHLELLKHGKSSTGEAVILYDGSKKIAAHKSSLSTLMKNSQICHSVLKRTPYTTMFKLNFVQYFKKALNFIPLKQNEGLVFNDYGLPIKDVYGNFLYDKYGIPLSGAKGIKLSEKARRILRLKLRNVPVIPTVFKKTEPNKEIPTNLLRYNESHDQFGDPLYDKYGRPRFDRFGKLLYDFYGRPLTDAFRRPLIDGIGQPLMDSNGNVLTSVPNSFGSDTLTDVYGRPLYDKRGRALFDSYGRPRFDIFTFAIYDSCGRPATDGNGKTLLDFMNKPIRPYPEKQIYKNPRALLPLYIDKILSTPSLRLVLKYSSSSLKDAFGGPLFDDFGKPLYNKIGKPLYDKYGRPLYDKDGQPLCDCYGRPVSEEIRQSANETTMSVLDSLKLLKLTKESSKWMEIKRSQTHSIQPSHPGVLDDAYVIKVIRTEPRKSTKYTYALTRVTTFIDGRQALEILEAPLSPATAKEMHNLPLDNKPMIMMARRRKTVKQSCKTQKN